MFGGDSVEHPPPRQGAPLVSIGTMDTMLVSPTSVFRLGGDDFSRIRNRFGASATHRRPHAHRSRHQSDPRPHPRRPAFKIEVVDHVVMGSPNFSSLRALGYFY